MVGSWHVHGDPLSASPAFLAWFGAEVIGIDLDLLLLVSCLVDAALEWRELAAAHEHDRHPFGHSERCAWGWFGVSAAELGKVRKRGQRYESAEEASRPEDHNP